MLLFQHRKHPHELQNANALHKLEQEVSGINTKIAVALTRAVGTMPTAYIFAILAILGFPGTGATPTMYVQWVSQTFIQLVMLPVLAVGQQVLGRHQEIMAEQQFKTTENTYHDIEQIIQHLSMQDSKILETIQEQSKQTMILMSQNEELSKQTTLLLQIAQTKQQSND